MCVRHENSSYSTRRNSATEAARIGSVMGQSLYCLDVQYSKADMNDEYQVIRGSLIARPGRLGIWRNAGKGGSGGEIFPKTQP
jgi:hypothetical protein